MARILRGEIRWATLGPARGHEQQGHRPVLILSNDVFNAHSRTVIAVALTSREPRVGYPLAFEINAPGLRKRSWVKLGQISTLSVARIGRKLANAPAAELRRAIDGLNEIIS